MEPIHQIQNKQNESNNSPTLTFHGNKQQKHKKQNMYAAKSNIRLDNMGRDLQCQYGKPGNQQNKILP